MDLLHEAHFILPCRDRIVKRKRGQNVDFRTRHRFSVTQADKLNNDNDLRRQALWGKKMEPPDAIVNLPSSQERDYGPTWQTRLLGEFGEGILTIRP
jgi:hypothetical protein